MLSQEFEILYVAEAEESIHSDAWQQRVDRTGAVYGEEKIGGEEKREGERIGGKIIEKVGGKIR